MAVGALFQGLVLGWSMIIPIGAQNSYILSQGIKRNYHYLIACICLICDVVLTTLGVLGGGKLIADNTLLMNIIGWGGILFLLTYATQALIRAYRFQYFPLGSVQTLSSRKAVILTTLAVTLLNPHVYLDTVVILGNIGSTFEETERLYFTAGAILAATIWFFTLAGLAAKLAPWLSKSKVQRWVDIFIAFIMTAVAYKLFATLLS